MSSTLENIQANFGLTNHEHSGLVSYSPIDGAVIGSVAVHQIADVFDAIVKSENAFKLWRAVPAPQRGELIRIFGEELRRDKENLGQLVTLECGKIISEGLGEVQEMIDICDFAVGLSRQLYGLTIASERSGHHMREVWHPLGPVGVISAFNFPVAVWAWNAVLAIICGNPVIWKPSEKTPLCAVATNKIFERAVAKFNLKYKAPENLSIVLQGGPDIGEALSTDPRIPLISATGSTRMGRAVSVSTASRLGRSLLELGGNNAMILAPSADLTLALRAILFSAVGTAGQRCTTLRRLIVHETIAKSVTDKLVKAYASLRIGNPLEQGTLIGPLIDGQAKEAMKKALEESVAQGGEILCGGADYPDSQGISQGAYVRPAIVRMPDVSDIVRHETFAPILYVLTYKTLDEAIALNNDVAQGLSSCIFTTDIREAEKFLSATGSDCGIANVNIGPSGAEIGGAFGGEKDTGGGRESGSDSWKIYMRRQTQTVNYSDELPLAQGVTFDL